MNQQSTEPVKTGGSLYSGTARAVSLLLALTLSTVILVYPNFIAQKADDINHGLLTLWMWGIAAGFVHGVGYIPVLTIWRFLLGPVIGWLFMIAGLLYFLLPN
jgi:cyd operon protein YbgE